MKLSAIASTLLAAVALVAGSDLAFSQTILNANPGPSNNGGSSAWAIFFDVTAASAGVTITEMTSASTAAAGAAFSVEVFVYNGSGLGGPVGAGPGSSPLGWTSLGIVPATQGATASGVSLPIDIPDIVLTQNQVTGVAVLFTGAGPRYFGTGTPPYSVYSDANLSLTTGDSRSAPFTTGGSFFTSRALVGSLTYTNGAGGPTGTVFCVGDGSGTACPCANNSPLGAGEGCLHSLGLGAKLAATGTASIAADTVVLHGSQMPDSSALYFQGTTQVGAGLGAVFGDGLRCAGGTVIRLKPTTNVAGSSQFPDVGDPSVSVKGNVTAPGSRTYQVWYRNAAAFCTASTFNLSNGLEVIWNP
jgi:hypothetical protein